MTRKDYIQTANILKSFAQDIPQTIYEDLVDTFAEWFKSDNENRIGHYLISFRAKFVC